MLEPEPDGSAFCKVAAVLWDSLRHEDAKAIRGVSREGRLLFDRLASRVDVTLGTESDSNAPSPDELTRAVRAAIARGTRPICIGISMEELLDGDDPSIREKQALALLAACAESPVKTEYIRLDGCPRLTRAIAAAVAARAPASLDLAYDGGRPAEPGWELDAEHYAALELLQGCLPRLEELYLRNTAAHFPPALLHSLGLGTALSELHIVNYGDADRPAASAAEIQSGLRAISGLSHLQRLTFTFACDDTVNRNFPDFPAACQIDLNCLAGLTSLTELQLNINQCRQHEGSADYECLEPEKKQRWVAVWEAQRAGLLAALRAMPNLSALTAYGMQLDVRPLAELTALKFLNLYGLLMPPPPPPPRVEAAVSPLHRWPLPRNLKTLTVCLASPTVLASLAPPPSLEYVCTNHAPNRLQFTLHDLDPGAAGPGVSPLVRPHLARGAVAAVQSAVGLLEGRLLPPLRGSLVVTVPGALSALRPPLPPAAAGEDDAEAAVAAPPLGGHAPWLSALGRLEGLRELTLECILLDVLDVRALAENLTGLKELELVNSPFPPLALPFLAAFPALARFAFDWVSCTRLHTSWRLEEVTLPALLHLGLNAPALGAVALTVMGTDAFPEAASLVAKAGEALAAQGSGVRLSLE